jgi:hypothetical protein
VEGSLVDIDVDGEAGVLHRVAREVLDAGHGVALDAPGQGGTHLADVMGVLAVGLLGAPPGRMAEDVDAHTSVEVGSDSPQLPTDGLADALFEVHVPGGPPGHADGEAGGPVDDHAPRTVGEREPRQPEPLHLGGPKRALVVARLTQVGQPGPEGGVAVEAPELLVGGHGGHDVMGRIGGSAVHSGSVRRAHTLLGARLGALLGGHGPSLPVGRPGCSGCRQSRPPGPGIRRALPLPSARPRRSGPRGRESEGRRLSRRSR